MQLSTQVLQTRAARRQIAQRNRARWLMLLWSVASLLLGIRLLVWPELSTAAFVELMAAFLLVGGGFELVSVLVSRHRGDSHTSLLFGTLVFVAAALVLSNDELAAPLSVPLQSYLLGLLALFWGLVKMLDQGSGDRDSWAGFVLGVLHLSLGGLLLLNPTFSILSILGILGAAIMLAGLTAAMLAFETQPSNIVW